MGEKIEGYVCTNFFYHGSAASFHSPKLNPTVYGPRCASPRPRYIILSFPSPERQRFIQFVDGEKEGEPAKKSAGSRHENTYSLN